MNWCAGLVSLSSANLLPLISGENRLYNSLGEELVCDGVWFYCHLSLSRIFVVLVEFLEDHVHDEGLFRKAGSVGRQRSLRVNS